MKRVVLLSCWLAAAMSGAAQARECKGVAFPDHLQVGGNDLTLNGLGMRKATFLKVNVYVTSVDMFPAVNEVYRRFFPKDPPARIFINVPAWNGGFDIEVDCIAAV